MYRGILTALFLTLITRLPLRAQLRWDRQQVDLSPSPVDTVAEASFGFVNAGANPLTIESAKSSCGCTVAKLEKATYAPGERGEIHARFDIGQRRGRHEVTINVAVAGAREGIALTLAVKIPEAARISPRILVWSKGEPNTPKCIVIESLPDSPLRVLNVTTSEPDFETKIETVRETAEYRITVSPKRTNRPNVAVLGIETQLMGGKKVLPAYAQVRP